jgi:hypothetical protein
VSAETATIIQFGIGLLGLIFISFKEAVINSHSKAFADCTLVSNSF